MNLLDMLMGSMTTESSVNSLAKKSGGSNQQIMMLVALALPILIKMMTNNASSQSGAQSLLGALTQHTNKKSMAAQIEAADEADGEKILGHILGSESNNVISSLADQTGMESTQVSSALSSMAPAVLSGLSAATSSANNSGVDLSDGLDLSDIMGMLGGTAQSSQSAPGLGSILGGLMGGAGSSQSADLLGGLLGGSAAQNNHSAMNGTALLSSLLGHMK